MHFSNNHLIKFKHHIVLHEKFLSLKLLDVGADI